LNPEHVAAYAARLLNEWVPSEVARLFIENGESGAPVDRGIPLWAVGTALERLLLREHLSRDTLEALILPELLSAEDAYPADLEILNDVVLWLLGRTAAPEPVLMPATLFCVAPDSHLPPNYREYLAGVFLKHRNGRAELHVPIAPAWAQEILRKRIVRVGSVIVTMDGRWWEAESVDSGEQHSIVYRSAGRLRIDDSGDHIRLRVPWPEKRLHWSGREHRDETFKIFGREWRVAAWVVDAERTWMDLVFFRVAPAAETDASSVPLARLRPAYVDMAWTALEGAVALSLILKSLEPFEQLRHPALIPLGRALAGFVELTSIRPSPPHETVEVSLRAVRFFAGTIASEYGKIPWRVLPAARCARLLNLSAHAPIGELFSEIFAGLPEEFRKWKKPGVLAGNSSRSTSSPHAA
jgi:hypothetical protein